MTPINGKPAGFIATIFAIIGLTIFTVIAYAAIPLLALLVGMGFGYILKLFTGDYVVQAFNALGLTKVGSDDLPKVFGLIAVVSVFFKSKVPTQNKRKGDD